MTVAELFARIGIKADDAQVKRFMGSMKAAKVGMIAMTAAAAGVSIAIKKITSDAMASAVAFKQFEVETGASAQELQKWQSVAEQTNQSAESVSAAIKSIVANQEKIKLGQGNISGFQLLGIDPRTDPFKILETLRDKTEGLTRGMKKNILATMGVGGGLLQTLELTREQFDAMSAKAFIISPGAIETLNKTKASVDLAGRAIKYIKAQIAVGLSPQIEKLTKRFTEFVKVNEKGIVEGFKKAFEFVQKFTGAIINTGKAINNVVVNTLGWEKAIKALVGVFILLNATLLFSPIGLITAGIILLIAVLDDLYVYSKGGKSLFGMMMEGIKNSKLMEWLENFVQKIKDMYTTIKQVFTDIGDFFEKTNTMSDIGLEAQQAAGFGGSYSQGLMNRSYTTNNNVEINATGVSDAQEIADKVKNVLQQGRDATSGQRGRDE